MVSKKEGTKSGNEDQEYQVESDIANTLPHTGRSHLELDGRDRGWMRIFCKHRLLLSFSWWWCCCIGYEVS
jgi:hypothetical protein